MTDVVRCSPVLMTPHTMSNHTTYSYTTLLITLALPLALMSGCQERAYKLDEPLGVDAPVRHWVEGLRHKLDEPLKEHVETQVSKDALKQRLKAANKLAWRKRIASDIKYADLFDKVYTQQNYRKAMVNHKGLTPRGMLALERIKTYKKHLISEPMNYHIEAIEKLDAQLKEMAKGEQEPPPIELTPEEIEALIALTKDNEINNLNDASIDILVTLIAESKMEKHPTPRIAKILDDLKTQVSKTAKLTTELELLVSDGLLRFARDMRHFNLNRMNWQQLKKAGGSRDVIYSRLEETLLQIREAKNTEIVKVLDSLNPPHPDYPLLVAMRERYITHMENDSWPKLTPFTLQQGGTSEHAPALRTRLVIEGYLPDNLTKEQLESKVVDDALVDAVSHYHTIHDLQFKNGRPHHKMWKNLRKSPAKRLKTIDLNIDRLRESRYEGEKDYIYINLPDFHAEMYEDHKRTYRFKVVIGKNNRKCNPDTDRFEYPNATPELHSDLEHFILNPSWYVPERIIEDEIKPQVEKDETWLERNHYEIVKKRGEKWIVRQTPGPHNALGLVKFIFPNPHNTYMHDTAKKEYFDYERRAYSHGCMRVHEPLKFAEKLVSFDQKDDVNVQEIVDSEQSKMIKLEKKLAVFVEYHTIQFDADLKAPRFLPDIYRHDRRELSSNPKTYDQCNGAALREKADEENDASPANTAGDLGP